MTKKPISILAINPGSRYIGTAVFFGFDLIDWRVKNVDAYIPSEKLRKASAIVRSFIDEYQPSILVVKKLHRCRSSATLKSLVGRIKQLARKRHLKVYQYSIKETEAFFSQQRKINKRQLARLLSQKYPALFYEFQKEAFNKNPYHIRAFEAVALGAVCSQQLDKK